MTLAHPDRSSEGAVSGCEEAEPVVVASLGRLRGCGTGPWSPGSGAGWVGTACLSVTRGRGRMCVDSPGVPGRTAPIPALEDS